MKGQKSAAIAIMFLLAALVSAQQPTDASSGVLKFEDGKIADGVYTNECLGISLPVPTGWEIDTQLTGPNGKAKHMGQELMLLVIHQQTSKGSRNTIALKAANTTGQPATAKELVSGAAKSFVVGVPNGRELVRDAYPVEYGGKQLFRADFKQSLPGMTVYEAHVITKFRAYFIGETIVAGSQDELDEAANSLKQISFLEDQPNARCIMSGEDPTPGVLVGVIGKPVEVGPNSRVRVSQKVSQALLLKKVDPIYPEQARTGHIQGPVVLQILVDTAGNVAEAKLISGDPVLAVAAQDAVKEWKYKPYLLNGQAVKMETQVVISFSLAGS